jgi:hypothetical protein
LTSPPEKPKTKREPITITLDVQTLQLLDGFIPNLPKESIEYLIKSLLRRAGSEAVKADMARGFNFREYMRKYPNGPPNGKISIDTKPSMDKKTVSTQKSLVA